MPDPATLPALLAEDAGLEPPTTAVARAMALSREIAARRKPAWNPLGAIGAALDEAGAVVASWIVPAGGSPAFALRDDRGGESAASTPTADGLSIELDRIPSVDGRVRFVGEVLLADGATLRGEIAVIDREGGVLASVALDAVGMFALELAPDLARRAVAIATSVVRADGRAVRPLIVRFDAREGADRSGESR
ncbi:MAG: hypothetical protein RI967_2332 [Planctomycetota bacterium]